MPFIKTMIIICNLPFPTLEIYWLMMETMRALLRIRNLVRKVQAKCFKTTLTLLGQTLRACSFCKKRKRKCSSSLSGKYPCHQCSGRGTNCNPSMLWVNEGKHLSLRSQAHHFQPPLASESHNSDSFAKSLVKTGRSATNVGEFNKTHRLGGPQPHIERSQALDSRDRQVEIGEMSKFPPTHPPIYYTPISQALTNSCWQNSESILHTSHWSNRLGSGLPVVILAFGL